MVVMKPGYIGGVTFIYFGKNCNC